MIPSKKRSTRYLSNTAPAVGIFLLSMLGGGFYASTTPSSAISDSLTSEISSRDWNKQAKKHRQDPEILPPEYFFFFKQYAQRIVEVSNKNNVPAEFVMALVVEENITRTYFQDIGDHVYSMPLFREFTNPSLGIGQIRVNTAKSLDKEQHIKEKAKGEIIAKLYDASEALNYIAMYVHAYMTKYPHDSTKGSFFTDIPYIASLGTSYVYGLDSPYVSKGSPEGNIFVYSLSNIPARETIHDSSITITREEQDTLREATRINVKKRYDQTKKESLVAFLASNPW